MFRATACYFAPSVAVGLCAVEAIRISVSLSQTKGFHEQRTNSWNAGQGCFIARTNVVEYNAQRSIVEAIHRRSAQVPFVSAAYAWWAKFMS